MTLLRKLMVTVVVVAMVAPLIVSCRQNPVTEGSADADPFPIRPMLRVEFETHQAKIRRMDVDAKERFLVTAADDKTARVWDLESGQLLVTLRPPIGTDHRLGKIYAVAISPDGETVALGGYLGASRESIYLFDRLTGQVKRRLTVANSVHHLTFSKNGRQLAAALGGKEGVRVYATGDWQELCADAGYGDDSHWAAFDGSGRLVTSSDDGYVRLYGADSCAVLAKVAPPGGRKPYGVAFSPDGRQVAVGFTDTSSVEILSGQNLGFERALESGQVPGDLATVVWSKDGAWLYAGGKADDGTRKFVRGWPGRGTGSYQDFPVAGDSIMDLHPLQDGRVVFSTGDAVWGVMDARGRILLEKKPMHPDLRAQGENFRLSADGGVVAFGLDYGGKQPVLFDVANRRLTMAQKTEVGLHEPRRVAHGLEIANWRESAPPYLNDRSLLLLKDEKSHSFAITPGGDSVVLGSDWFLRHFDRSGQELWRQPTAEAVWAVNVSRDGRLAVAGYGDGTIRWHRMSDGAEILALLIMDGGKQWVLWNPDGYYAASPGAEKWVGWHINQGRDQAAAFYPISRFRQQFFRFDVVAQMLKTLDGAEALRLADEQRGVRSKGGVGVEHMLPPRVWFRAPVPEFTASQVTLYYQVDPQSMPVTAIEIRLNGRAIAERRIIAQSDPSAREGKFVVKLPPKDVKVSLFAKNSHGYSAPAEITLKWRGGNQSEHNEDDLSKTPSNSNRNLNVLAVGMDNYNVNISKLRFARKDAEDFGSVMVQKQGEQYDKISLSQLPDVFRPKILEGLEWLWKETTEQDVAMLFFSGHGANRNDDEYFFLPVDSNLDDLAGTAVSATEINNILRKIPGQVLLFMDSCHSGQIRNSDEKEGRRGDLNKTYSKLSDHEHGLVIFASSSGSELSFEIPENGYFTGALVAGLKGEADENQNGIVTIQELGKYVEEKVKKDTKSGQNPVLYHNNNKNILDFSLAVK
ncbi:MAG: caspase family protein [Magnetococcales bacterium]|nr:caspase family protein [Magnetococcales bacterium]